MSDMADWVNDDSVGEMPDDETPCPKREDGQHCNCWYDSESCCACGAPSVKTEQAAADRAGRRGIGDRQ